MEARRDQPCVCCGAFFSPGNSLGRTCSVACRKMIHRRRRKPRLLDLFCGAGGAARGYARAGFDVTGVDVAPQPRYLASGAARFVQGDALRPPLDLRDFDVVHASPPCQAYSRATPWRGDPSTHPDLIGAVRRLLAGSGRPYVIETVEGGAGLLHEPVLLCGTHFGLRLRRHRYFECAPVPLSLRPGPCMHRPRDHCFDHGFKATERAYADAMGCDWMTVLEAREAIPPAYALWVGRHLMNLVPRRTAPAD
jgi:DNA (cytosine-5)-methyltransferase 1